MSDALSPLRHAYGMKVPQPSNRMNAALGAPGRIEVELIQQGRALLEAAPKQAPSSSVLDTVRAFAAGRQREGALRTAAVAVAYGERDAEPGQTLPLAELGVLRQGKDLLEGWTANARSIPSEAAFLAVVSRAADATRVAPPRELVVGDAALQPLALAYGLPLAVGAATDSGAEADLLASTRAALDSLPREVPQQAVTAAVLARAAEMSCPPSPAAASRTHARPAPDRAATEGSTSRRRTGLIAGLTSAAGALVLALVLWPSGANTPAGVGGSQRALASDVTAESAAPAPSAETADRIPQADAEPFVGQMAAGLAPVDQAVPAERPSRPGGPSNSDIQGAAIASAAAAPVPASAPLVRERAPQNVSRSSASAEMVEAAPRVSASAPAPDWDMPTDHRVVSLRMNELKRANTGIRWDAPAEAFGAPKTVDRSSASPSIRVVREGAAPARARLLRDSIPRN